MWHNLFAVKSINGTLHVHIPYYEINWFNENQYPWTTVGVHILKVAHSKNIFYTKTGKVNKDNIDRSVTVYARYVILAGVGSLYC